MNPVTFSIIIPTFNRRLKLQKALESIFKQTHTDFEIIVYDDGSVDGTDQMIKQFSSPLIRYFWKENSGLPSVGRNFGISQAKGNWLCFLDSDDYWEASKLEKIFNAIVKNPTYQIFSHNEFLINGKNEICSELIHGKKSKLPYFEYLMLKDNCLSPSAITIKKEILQENSGFNTSSDFFSVEDFDLWLRITKNREVYHLNESLGYCLVDGAGISSGLERHLTCLKNVYNKHVEELPPHLHKRAWATYYYIKARAYHRGMDLINATMSYREALKFNVFFFKAWIGLVLVSFKIQK